MYTRHFILNFNTEVAAAQHLLHLPTQRFIPQINIPIIYINILPVLEGNFFPKLIDIT